MTPWVIQSVEFSRREYWSGEPFLFLGDLPNPKKGRKEGKEREEEKKTEAERKRERDENRERERK